jgi:hypothetical protein
VAASNRHYGSEEMGTRIRRRKWGAVPIGENQWRFRDPAHPHRRAIIRDITRDVHYEWKRATIWWRYSLSYADKLAAMATKPRGQTFEVWLETKHRAKKERISGDLLDACALASQIIHRPPKVQR